MDSLSFLQAPTQVTCAHFQRTRSRPQRLPSYHRRFRRGEPLIIAGFPGPSTPCFGVAGESFPFTWMPRRFRQGPVRRGRKSMTCSTDFGKPRREFFCCHCTRARKQGYGTPAPLSRQPGAPGRNCACRPAARPRNRARTPARRPPLPALPPSPRAP